jgi:uncharacterized protein YdhG (YjbR/CyaY superfamily)
MATSVAHTVDEYIAGFPVPVQKRLKQMRRAVKRAAPRATETISYRIPAYRLDGRVIYFAAFKTHIGMYPVSASIQKGLKELAEYASPRAVATVRFPHDRPIPQALVGRIVRLMIEKRRARSKARARNRSK